MAPSLRIWQSFEYRELVQNMRQKEDLEYANLMGRMRVQALSTDDIAYLQTRVIKSKSGLID